MQLMNEGQNEWNASYISGGNILFYPHEEIVRFVNKYVRKRENMASFKNVMELTNAEWQSFRSLDLGCGIGRHMKFLDEFGLNPYGIDLSGSAIAMGKNWLYSIGRPSVADNMSIGSVAKLPYEDNWFQICVSHGVLDSMERDIAIKGMQEVHRVLKQGGMMYLDLVMDNASSDVDEIVESGYEMGTIQSYFTLEGIHKLFEKMFEIIELKIIEWKDASGNAFNRRAHLIIKKV